MSTINPTTNTSLPIEDQDLDHGVWDVLYDMPAWGISLLVHIGIIVALMSITWVIETQVRPEITSTIEPEEVRQEQFVIDTEVTEEIGSLSDMNIVGPSMATAQATGFDNHIEQEDRISEDIIDPRVQFREQMPTPNEADILESIDLTGTTEHAGGTAGAIDRITQEIAASLRQRKTLVVWLMDESGSMEERRAEVADRFKGIYDQLGALDVGADEALRSAVISYGKDVHILQGEPTASVEDLNKAVASIKNDPSGLENVFSAVDTAVKKFRTDKRRMKANMMIVIVTDERGDDYAALETVVRNCSREGVKVYCVGNTSVFGREKGLVHVKWKSPDGEEFEDDLEADMGPETFMAEGIQLPFWNRRASGLSRMSSGYGPYTLSRLCAETGGVFFVAADNNRNRWDDTIMRQYSPDYRPAKDYMRQLSTNGAKAALVNAARQTMLDGSSVPLPQTTFAAQNDNILRQQITEAQKPLATLDYYLQQLHGALEAGERDRNKLDSDRWRASYDLAMGRVLAMRVRAFGYNAMLAEMKSTPKTFEKEGSNQWRLQPAGEINAGATVRKLHKKALEYLKRVIDEHPGTPWAHLASVELGDPLGWEWKEHRIQVAANNMGNGNNNNPNSPQFAPEEERRRQEQRRREQKKAQFKPKI
ncbi:MAG: VWA domain-containing protein [Planctomycetaceae bacterium]|nr:VWA domain-containing protein [Planctomycetaceae bacterium]